MCIVLRAVNALTCTIVQNAAVNRNGKIRECANGDCPLCGPNATIEASEYLCVVNGCGFLGGECAFVWCRSVCLCVFEVATDYQCIVYVKFVSQIIRFFIETIVQSTSFNHFHKYRDNINAYIPNVTNYVLFPY